MTDCGIAAEFSQPNRGGHLVHRRASIHRHARPLCPFDGLHAVGPIRACRPPPRVRRDELREVHLQLRGHGRAQGVRGPEAWEAARDVWFVVEWRLRAAPQGR
eukprot:3154535-Prymnesium_polylepis.1